MNNLSKGKQIREIFSLKSAPAEAIPAFKIISPFACACRRGRVLKPLEKPPTNRRKVVSESLKLFRNIFIFRLKVESIGGQYDIGWRGLDDE